jgi:hypothetical protein
VWGCPRSVPHEAVMRFARSSGPSLRELGHRFLPSGDARELFAYRRYEN